jgi:hypothetical protein
MSPKQIPAIGMAIPRTIEAFESLLQTLNPPQKLLNHIALVNEAAQLLVAKYLELGLLVDQTFIHLGVMIHDIGKVQYPQELLAPGQSHETNSERLMLSLGVDPALARCCVSHAQWRRWDCSLEELTVALADKLWRGKRVPELEQVVINEISKQLCKQSDQQPNWDQWHLFVEMDSAFEAIADGGNDRLNRSQHLCYQI